jgi:hypothetical protein
MFRRFLGVALMSAAAAFLLQGIGRGQQKPGDGGPKPGADKPTPGYYGTQSCAFCHTQPPDALKGVTFLCRCTEFKIWKGGDKAHPDIGGDKHQLAYTNLGNDLGKQMQRLLKYDVQTSPKCLSCHGVVFHDKAAEERSKQHGFKLADGVSCVVCHGAYTNWVAEHGVDFELWRKQSRQWKEEEKGMTDLWDPVKRSRLCASCHVGAPDEGKVITHEMYAAGHPPLPSFEAATFGNQMPRHWQYLREKEPAVQKVLDYNPKNLEESKLVVINAAVSLEQTMKTLAAQARDAAEAKEADDRVLDFAQFDCYACHHDLKSPSWRQQRGYAGKPGRPGMHPWSTDLVRLAIPQAEEDPAAADKQRDELAAKLKALTNAFDTQPFGDLARIRPASQAVADWAGALARKLAARPCEEPQASRLLTHLAQTSGQNTVDYDTARQLAWAFRIVEKELHATPPAPVLTSLDTINRELKLELPSGTKQSIEKQLGANLDVRNNYDPARFQEVMRRLAAEVGQKGPPAPK